jgi:hypothetical protein
MGFIWEERRVNATEHDPRSACARHLADRIAAQGIPRVNVDVHDISGRHIERTETD